MEIAKGIKNTDYLNLDLNQYTNTDWNTAIKSLDQRLTERYLEPVDVLIAAESGKKTSEHKFGFTILGIDCLLIETIQSFYEGITDSTGRSRQLFTAFLMQRSRFKTYFPTQIQADEFYKNFRCGILHQAQTFGNTLVRIIGPEMISRRNGTTTVNRKLFHESVRIEKDNYITALQRKDNFLLLDNFKTKMDYICK